MKLTDKRFWKFEAMMLLCGVILLCCYAKSDASIVYSPFVVFEYAGGAIGSQNFIGKDEYLKKQTQSRQENRK